MKTDDGIKIHAIMNTDELRWTETMEGERERERSEKRWMFTEGRKWLQRGKKMDSDRGKERGQAEGGRGMQTEEGRGMKMDAGRG